MRLDPWVRPRLQQADAAAEEAVVPIQVRLDLGHPVEDGLRVWYVCSVRRSALGPSTLCPTMITMHSRSCATLPQQEDEGETGRGLPCAAVHHVAVATHIPVIANVR
jgi:hypothetical protein